jgi:hypothetical protein
MKMMIKNLAIYYSIIYIYIYVIQFFFFYFYFILLFNSICNKLNKKKEEEDITNEIYNKY